MLSMEANGIEWERGSLIGQGSSGSVFFAQSKSSSSFFPPLFAVKSAEVCQSGALLHKEVETLINLQGSPYIIRCFGEETTTSYGGDRVCNLLMEYASGGPLSTLIETSKGLAEREVRRYARQILLGLSHIHRSGYVHCDIKPENVLLVSSSHSAPYVAKIADFGLCKKTNSDPYLRGTPLYMAPEAVVDGIQEAPSDMWALGCLFLEMFTGKPPWNFDHNLTTEELLINIGNHWALPVIPKGLSDEARSFLKACLVRKPMFRFTADMLLDHPFLTQYEADDIDAEKEEEEEEEEEEIYFFF